MKPAPPITRHCINDFKTYCVLSLVVLIITSILESSALDVLPIAMGKNHLPVRPVLTSEETIFLFGCASGCEEVYCASSNLARDQG